MLLFERARLCVHQSDGEIDLLKDLDNYTEVIRLQKGMHCQKYNPHLVRFHL